MDKKISNFNHLYTFYLIGKSGTLSRAADLQGVSKASLSTQMKRFEADVDIPLFDRSSKRLLLTPLGQMVFDHAERMFDIAKVLEKSMVVKKNFQNKSIAFGITTSVSQSFSVKALSPILSSKEFTPVIKEAAFKNLVDELFKRNVDVILHEDRFDQDYLAGLRSDQIGTNEYVILGSKNFKHLAKNFPESIDNIPFFSFALGSSIRTKLDLFFLNRNISIDIFGETNSFDLIREATLSGHCISALPKWTVEKYIADGSLFLIGEIDDPIEKIYATYRSKENTERLQRVLKILKST